jgi:superfamily II DNA/RNA helicase
VDSHPARTGPTWITFLGLLNRARHQAIAKVLAAVEAVQECLDAEEKVIVFTSYSAVVQHLLKAFGSSAVSITGEHTAAERHESARRLQKDPSTRVLIGNLQAAGAGITLMAATHVIFNDLDWVPGNHWQADGRSYRIGQTRTAFATYLYAENTLDEFVAALLEAKARNIGVLETEAAHSATLLHQVVEAALRGERPGEPGVASSPARASSERSVGLLDDTLDLLARARRGLASVESDEEQVHQVPSKSKPGEFNTVTVARGIARCTCSGFQYRGDCSHTRQIVAKLS